MKRFSLKLKLTAMYSFFMVREDLAARSLYRGTVCDGVDLGQCGNLAVL